MQRKNNPVNKIVIKKYPYNSDCAFIVGLDDLHPEGIKDIEMLDFGKNFKGDFWIRINTLIHSIPEIKVTLFTPAAWTDRSNFPSGFFWPLRKIYSKRRSYQEGFELNKKIYNKWAIELNNYIKKGNIILAYHGLTHHNDEKKYAASQEFEGISYNQTEEKVQRMLSVVQSSQLKFAKGFRSPGWGTTDFLNKILKENNFLYTANSTDFTSSDLEGKSKGTGIKGQAIINITQEKEGISNFTANCYPHQIQRAVEIAKKKGIIVVHAHVAKTIFGIKYVDEHFAPNVLKMVSEIRNQSLSHIWFASFDEVVNFIKIRDKIKISQKGQTVTFVNPTSSDIKGLTAIINNKPHVVPILKGGENVTININKIERVDKISMILTVYNGAHQVIPSLESLCNQSYSNTEIIIVNDGSTDNTKEILNDYILRSKDSRLHVIHQKNGGRSNARNNGFKKSTGSIITFCEDDALYDRDYVLNAVKHFVKKDKKLGGVIGPHYVWNKNESFNTRVKDVERRRNFYQYKPQSVWFYRRNLFEEIGMFDESLELVEDVVPAILLKKKGYHFKFEPEARWLHKEPPGVQSYLRRKFRGGVGMALLQKKSLRKTIVPFYYSFILAMFIIIGLVLLVLRPILIIPAGVLGLLALCMLRYRSFIISLKVSDEPWYFLVFSLLYEYLWWASTLLGYLKGLTMSSNKITYYLRGR